MLDLSSLSSFFLLGFIGWFTYKVYIWPCYISPLRNVPGPPSTNPLFGHFMKIFLEEAGELQVKWAKTYGTVFKFHEVFNRPAIVVADAKLLQEITLNHVYDYTKPFSATITQFLGDGLLTAEGESHKRQRKMMNPAFVYSNVKEMIPSFTRVALTLKGLIEDRVGAGESRINLTPYISRAALDAIGLAGFNYEFNSLTSTNELAEAYESITKPSIPRFIIGMMSEYIPYVTKIPIGINKRYNRASKIIGRISKKLVEEKYHKAENNKLNEKDLLSLLININKTLPTEERITDDELKYQVMTFLLAGHETTNALICWALYELARHPHEQDLLREELVKAFPDKSEFNPTLDEINSLEYLNCVLKETLRLDSPAPATLRTSTKDQVIGDHFIPKGTLFLLSIISLHKLPSIWGPTANDFDPKRWLNPKDEFKTNFVPFLNGARNCIGNKVALNEFKVVLSALIRNFVFRPVEDLHISKKMGFGVKPYPRLELMVSKA